MTAGAVLGSILRRPALAAAGLAAMSLTGAAVAFGSGLGAAGARAAAALAVLAVCAALFGRRRTRGSALRPLSLEGRQPLGRDCGVAVVRWDGRRFLVGYGTAGASVLAELSGKEAP